MNSRDQKQKLLKECSRFWESKERVPSMCSIKAFSAHASPCHVWPL